MLNFKSVTSSEPQVRSNPALRPVHEKSGFQKRISTLLEPTALPFPTYQVVKEPSLAVLRTHPHYAWVRPAHLRSQWLMLQEEFPLMLLDQRDSRRMYSIRVPFDKRRVQQIGPIVCECSWDAQDHVLWIWDVVVWEKQVVWNTMPYTKRWELVKQVVGQILDCGHPMSDAEVRVPAWQSMESVAVMADLDPAMSVDFMPEKPGQRRHVFVIRDESVKFVPTNHAERKMVAEGGPKVHDPNQAKRERQKTTVAAAAAAPAPAPAAAAEPIVAPVAPPAPAAPQEPVDRPRVARIMKDKYSKLPDSYRLETATGEDLGLAAIRSLELSKQLRTALAAVGASCMVDIQWFEPFQKYDVRRVIV